MNKSLITLNLKTAVTGADCCDPTAVPRLNTRPVLRRGMQRFLAVMVAGTLLAACSQDATVTAPISTDTSTNIPAEIADTLYVGGRIYTGNSLQPWVQAVAIKDGHFSVVGTDQAVMRSKGPATRVVELEGRMAMAGLVDAHVHPLIAGIDALYRCKFSPKANINEVEAALKQCHEQLGQGEWLLGGRYYKALFDQQGIDNPRLWLDRISATTPIVLRDAAGHNAVANTAALAAADYFPTPPVIASGDVVVDAQGQPTGLLVEAASFLLLRNVAPTPTDQQYLQAARYAQTVLQQHGIVAVKDAGAYESMQKAWYDLDRAGELNLFVATSIRDDDSEWVFPQDLQTINRRRDAYRSERVDTREVKLFLDGVPGARTAAMLAPYATDKEHPEQTRGELRISPEALTDALIMLDAEGYTVKIHAAGDRSARVVLDAIEAMRRVNGDSGLLHELAHSNFIHAADMPRFAQFNVVADLSPAIWYPSSMRNAVTALVGEERNQQSWPVHSLAAAGAVLLAGSDWPSAVSSPNPWPGIEALVTRRNPYGKHPGELGTAQAISLQRALHIYSIEGARAMRHEDNFGSVEAGKIANLIVLNQHLFAVPAEQISDTEVLETVIAGVTVYKRH